MTWLTVMEYLCCKWPRICSTCKYFPVLSSFTTYYGFVTRLTWRVPLEEHLSSPQFLLGSCYSIFSFICMFSRSLFVLLYFFFWPLCCLFFDIQIMITPLVSCGHYVVCFLRFTDSDYPFWYLRFTDSDYLPLVSWNSSVRCQYIFYMKSKQG
jgi:hypothetical protein